MPKVGFDITVTRNGARETRPYASPIVSLGAARESDIVVPSAPNHWAIVAHDDNGPLLRVLGSGQVHRLRPDDITNVDGVGIEITNYSLDTGGLSLGRLAERLANAEKPDEALRQLLRDLLEVTRADGGAVLLKEGAEHVVAVAETAKGKQLEGAETLLSHSIVTDVLHRGRPIAVRDAFEHAPYSLSTSVIALRLRSVICAPMVSGQTVIGAIFLGKRNVDPFSDATVVELQAIAAMAVPLLIQMRRIMDRGTSQSDELLVGECEPMQHVRKLVTRLASSDLAVLIQGDTGTGKERVAQGIHAASPRRDRALIALNCAAVPESLLAAELFGSKRGAYTGAVADRKGKFELAHGSTLFLDEVGDMPLSMQAALLRVLEERTVTRLGDDVVRPVDFRLIAATHRNLDDAVREGRFREDLLFRIREVTVELPSLAQRGDDILLLGQLFLNEAARQFGTGNLSLSRAAQETLLHYAWPGNVRELRSTMRRAAVLCEKGTVEPAHLQLGPSTPRSQPPITQTGLKAERPLADAREEFTERYVRAAVEQHGGNREAAASSLGISLRSVYRYLGGN